MEVLHIHIKLLSWILLIWLDPMHSHSGDIKVDDEDDFRPKQAPCLHFEKKVKGKMKAQPGWIEEPSGVKA